MPTILVVDDDDVIRELVRFKLGSAGFDVHMEADGEAGLAAARELLPDLLLADWMMCSSCSGRSSSCSGSPR